jgi:hypothetical protein
MDHNAYDLYNLYEIEITLKSDLEIYAFVRLAPSEFNTIREAVKKHTMVRHKRCIEADPQALDSCGHSLCGASFTCIDFATHLNIQMQVNKHLVRKMLRMMGCEVDYLYRI